MSDRLKNLNEDEFELSFRRYCDNIGSSYDPWDIAYSFQEYKNHSDEDKINNYKHLIPFLPKI